MTSRTNSSELQGSVRGADKVAQMKRESDRRVEAQRVESLKLTAKIQRLKALRLERDAQLAQQIADAPAPVSAKAAKASKAAAAKLAAAAEGAEAAEGEAPAAAVPAKRKASAKTAAAASKATA